MARFLTTRIAFTLLFFGVTCIMSAGSTFKTLITFNGTDGANPVDTPLVQGRDGNLYGTTLGGGTNAAGTVFRMTPAGKLTTIYSFCSVAQCADGSLPYGGLVLAIDGNFYGTTSQGGASGVFGTVFRITPGGTLTTLHSFNLSDGAFPNAPLILGADGDLYGLTQNGGPSNSGTFFKITLDGSLTSLYNFTGVTLNGPLVQASDGNFYSTSEMGGANGDGMIFKLDPSGNFSILHSFNGTDGSFPACGLLQAADGDLYGTTYSGGSNNSCNNGCGTVFKMSLTSGLTTLLNFDLTGGSNPIAALIQGTDGNLYGTTYGGGTGGGWGTVYKTTRTGTLTTLHSFQGTDGGQPYGPVSQDTNGNFYGTATNGSGSAPQGTVFVVSTGFKPFVSFIENRGKVGMKVDILGQGFKGTSIVSFNGKVAKFKVHSNAYLTATVPQGATTGYVSVTTPKQKLRSNTKFQVIH